MHKKAEPVHVTLRCRFRSLRSQFVFPTVQDVIERANRRGRGRFRVVHFSVQANHVHLIVEAEQRRALLAGVRGFAVSLARGFNRLVGRTGRLFADRWHGRALTTPRAVRHALVYVLANAQKHGELPRNSIDAMSSAPYFRNFTELQGRTPEQLDPKLVPRTKIANGPPITEPESWLLCRGWLRHGTISLQEVPRS